MKKKAKKKSDASSHDRKAAVSSVDGEEFQTLISNGRSGGICSHVREAGSCRNGSSSSVERVTDIGAEKKKLSESSCEVTGLLIRWMLAGSFSKKEPVEPG